MSTNNSRESKAVDKMKNDLMGNPGRGKGGARTAEDTTEEGAPMSGAAKTKEALHRAIRINESSNDAGQDALSSLGKQRETIQRSIETVDNTNDNLRGSRRVLHDMKMALLKERVIKGITLVTLVLIIIIIIYVKWLRNTGSSKK